MIIKVIFGQRRCSYEGEYAPEALAVIDEYGDYENPEYLIREFENAQASMDYIGLAVVEIEIRDDQLDRILLPAKNPIPGKIMNKEKINKGE